MPSTFEDLLRLELQATGENQNTWGTKTNNNLELLADAIAGHVSIAVPGSGNYTLTTSNAAVDEARRAFITLSGILTGNRNIIVPSTAKTYVFRRNTTGAFDVIVKTATGTGVALPSSGLAVVVCDGTETYALAVADYLLRTGGEVTGVVSVSVSTSVSTASAFVLNNTGAGPALHVPSGRVGLRTNDPLDLIHVSAGGVVADRFGRPFADTSAAFYAGTSVAAALSTGASRIVVEAATISANTTTGNPTGAIGIYAGGKNPVQLVSDTINGTWVASRTELATSVTDLPAYVVDVSGGIRTQGPITLGSAQASAPPGAAPLYFARAWAVYNGVDAVLVTSQGITSVTRTTIGQYQFTLAVTAPHANYATLTNVENRAGQNCLVSEVLLPKTSTLFNVRTVGINGSTQAGVNTSTLSVMVLY